MASCAEASFLEEAAPSEPAPGQGQGQCQGQGVGERGLLSEASEAGEDGEAGAGAEAASEETSCACKASAPSGPRRCFAAPLLALLAASQRCRKLSELLALWASVAEAERRQRGAAFCDALGGQLRAAKDSCVRLHANAERQEPVLIAVCTAWRGEAKLAAQGRRGQRAALRACERRAADAASVDTWRLVSAWRVVTLAARQAEQRQIPALSDVALLTAPTSPPMVSTAAPPTAPPSSPPPPLRRPTDSPVGITSAYESPALIKVWESLVAPSLQAAFVAADSGDISLQRERGRSPSPHSASTGSLPKGWLPPNEQRGVSKGMVGQGRKAPWERKLAVPQQSSIVQGSACSMTPTSTAVREAVVSPPRWADMEEIEAARVVHSPRAQLPRGPERFFYDTARYTGCARFGGHTVVDGLCGPPSAASPLSRLAATAATSATGSGQAAAAAGPLQRVASTAALGHAGRRMTLTRRCSSPRGLGGSLACKTSTHWASALANSVCM